MTENFARMRLHRDWDYTLVEDVKFSTPYRLEAKIVSVREEDKKPMVSLDTNGDLILYAGYSWNGPTGWPKRLQTNGMKFGALPHDGIYGLMCDGLLSRSAESREIGDNVLRVEMKRAGCWGITSESFYRAVRIKGRDFANPRQNNRFLQILVIP